MAEAGKPDSRLFQIMMVIITSVVAPVCVYFLTHSLEVPTKAAALTPTSAISTATAIATVTPSPDQRPTAIETEIPAGRQNPQGILPAGEIGIVDNLSVQVLADDISIADGSLSLEIHVRNLSSQPQSFTYRRQSIAVRDDQGHPLEVIYGDKKLGCSKKDLSTDQKISLAPGQEILLHSVEAGSSWCKGDSSLMLTQYRPATKDRPQSITVQFNDFGLFSGFGYRIDF